MIHFRGEKDRKGGPVKADTCVEYLGERKVLELD